ncbi:Ig-like domain-containing protein [Devosia sp. RR2S18]|nr:Ig-like domain-containing protein [Devosia sp. RR2S18]WIJ27071.1 Ig-like domain-containing protein [Devosia sp. RR2S18]
MSDGPTGVKSDQADLVMSGQAEALSTVKIYNGHDLIHTTTADSAGNWTWAIGKLDPKGPYSLSATATDSAGNVSSASQALTFAVNKLNYGPLFGTFGPGAGPIDGRGELYAGIGNPADGMSRSVAFLGPADIELALDVRLAGDPADVTYLTYDPGLATYWVNPGANVRFAYSAGVNDLNDDDTNVFDLSTFDFKLLIDTDAGLGTNFKSFTLLRQETGNPTANQENSPDEWVLDSDPSTIIRDDGGNGYVTQNIQALHWYNGTSALNAGANYQVKLQAFAKDTNIQISETSISVLGSNDWDHLGNPAGETLNGVQSGSPTFVDTLYGGAGNDDIFGYGGADYLSGGSGSDELYGGDGDDHLYGGSGNDLLHGGLGADQLLGQFGADRFTFGGQFDESTPTSMDTIRDWDSDDLIDLSAIDAVKTFAFRGQGNAVAEMEVRYYHENGNTYVIGQNTSSNSVVNHTKIEIIGLHNLEASDFVL